MSARSAGESATLACLLEAIAPKPGNVHRGADFDDLTFQDLAISAVLLGQVFQEADRRPVGWLIRNSVERIDAQVGRNTYLGTVLLLAPLAKSTWRCEGGDRCPFRSDLDQVLAGLTPDDAQDAYLAIRRASPGGLGAADAMDVFDPPPQNLIAAMKLAEQRDLIAYQYANGFRTVSETVLPTLDQGLRHGWTISDSIVYAHVTLMAHHPDSLIGRKLGPEVAAQSQEMAGRVLDAGLPGNAAYASSLANLDFWLRCDGHRRNPGTTADLIAAALFVLLQLGRIPAPIR